jgi:hypothetical protein
MNMFRRYLLVLTVVCGLAVVFAASALGDGPAPGWAVTGRFGPTNLPPGGVGILHLYVYNIGAGEATGKSPVLIDQLPEGLEAVSEIKGSPKPEKYHESPQCSGAKEVTCELGSISGAGGADGRRGLKGGRSSLGERRRCVGGHSLARAGCVRF